MALRNKLDSWRNFYIDKFDLPLFVVVSLAGTGVGAICTVIMAGFGALSWVGAGWMFLASTVAQAVLIVIDAPEDDPDRLPDWRGRVIVLALMSVFALAVLVVPRLIAT